MPLLTLKTNRHSSVLYEFKPNDIINTIKSQIGPKGMTNFDRIVLYFHDKRIDDSLTFSQANIFSGSTLIYLIKGDGKTMDESDMIIEMLDLGIPYHKATVALSKSNNNLKQAIRLAQEEDSSLDDSSVFSDDESLSEFIPTPHVEQVTSQFDSSNDYAEEVLSENFKSNESGLN
ncbi:hypothetical protein EDI_245270 [Entamoeba dispar SAW760]|uniref:Ubiquitin-like domain-containing protein n=1 Tax=Entamoeba dispar (strain ATCC PRA-260 / SAW760) TaxID=370354 RepID=B0EE63_ENTDS|nr:uncharacterized protein EDI_245270 [Entamoeba dispar SAW760]EDR27187.1 hypothetical protein EDI_245270 [Entamoeba dispar SAW760]|eukprot:EDR27187.1 hypothetical protein EDI_245270 [Entamoeba dispar SAW760]